MLSHAPSRSGKAAAATVQQPFIRQASGGSVSHGGQSSFVICKEIASYEL